MIKNVAIYCRVSTEEQKKFGISVTDQKNSLTEYCKKNNYNIYDYYIDEGVSASTISKRKEFVRLLKELNHIDLIVFTKLDRFSRNVRDANNLLVELDKHNTSFRAIDEDDIDTSTADGRFIFNLKVNLAEHERNKDSERINRVNKYKYNVAKTVCTGAKIFGYDIDEHKHYVVNQKEAELLNKLYDRYIESGNLAQTCKWFKDNYVDKSFGTIRIYLTDTKYIGKFKTTKTKEILQDFCPAIISEEKFYRVQSMLKRNIKNYQTATQEKRTFIFSGLCICSACGFKMSGGNRGKNQNYLKHYRCAQHYKELKCPNKSVVTERDIEQYLKQNIIGSAENFILEVTQKKVKTSKDKSKEIKSKMDKLVDLYLNNIIDKKKYENEYKRLAKELERENVQKKEEVKIQDISHIKDFLNKNIFKIYDELSDEEKQMLWKSIIEELTITDKNNIKINFIK